MENLIKKKFNNPELGIVFESYIDEECCCWFKAKEVAQVLNYKNTEHAIKRHVSENHKKYFLLSYPPETGGQVQGRWLVFIDEAGLYELVFKSRLPTAKDFREWIFSEVLPAIRKYGYFNMYKSKRKRRVIIDGKKFYKHPEFSNYAASKDGVVINVKNNNIISMSKNNCGYLYFSIYNKNLKKTKTFYQHRFVYEVIKGKIPSNLEIDHINGNKTDNRIKNLQLLTHQQNIEKSKNKPIISTCIQTGEERRFKSVKTAGIELDINYSHISKVCKKIYKFLTSKKDGFKYTFRYLEI